MKKVSAITIRPPSLKVVALKDGFYIALVKLTVYSFLRECRIFNTNNLWVSLEAMNRVVERHALHLEIIVNPKVNYI